jgi:Lrp/AsnC family leucine-responsive transcriptional regulator
MASRESEAGQFDEVNVRLLAELHADPGISMSELARRAGMSALAVTEQVQRMRAAGVIAGFRMDVDPAAAAPPPAGHLTAAGGPVTGPPAATGGGRRAAGASAC